LAESSPVITSNRITIGEKRARAYAFDIFSGALIAEFSNSASVSYTDNLMTDDIVVISVVEYSYQVLDPRSMNPI